MVLAMVAAAWAVLLIDDDVAGAAVAPAATAPHLLHDKLCGVSVEQHDMCATRCSDCGCGNSGDCGARVARGLVAPPALA